MRHRAGAPVVNRCNVQRNRNTDVEIDVMFEDRDVVSGVKGKMGRLGVFGKEARDPRVLGHEAAEVRMGVVQRSTLLAGPGGSVTDDEVVKILEDVRGVSHAGGYAVPDLSEGVPCNFSEPAHDLLQKA